MTATRWVATGVAVALLGLAACTSPEGKRRRGGDAGGDIKNRDSVVRLHAGSEMYFDTPCLLPDDECTGPRPASGLPGDFPTAK